MNTHDKNMLETLSVVIPAYNEAVNLQNLLPTLIAHLNQANIPHEILVVNDNSSDDTELTLKHLMNQHPTLRYINNAPPNGFGLAVRCGLQAFTGDAVVIVMADGSDAPEDIVRFYRKLQEGYDCVFGSRFMLGGKAVDYPLHKKILNRLANNFIRVLFQFRYNDITNAFKCYRRHVIVGLQPLLAHHFNLTVELPLKSIIRGYQYAVIPNAWYNRKEGVSKLKIREMGSRYLFIVLYCLIERLFSRGDYKIEPQAKKKLYTART
ncbi:MAG TPA: glycosyltransferase family 2 protein [Candidatus Berkiella sp.]|nr:glycosyltransferase family 2 protein [Candidatus Berkiella sp.]